ncbi:MAG: aminoglycoside phosphotransferase family protein [Lachnospiraceae bacterium]|nr:aminoglycoside phosphotransferase family protein [Lachnospiraceae bacterium]
MQVTYDGQLERIEEELDLTIEARNVELGKIYDVSKTEEEQKVVSMKLNKLIAPTTNAMVLDKAPGETLDALLKRIKAETKRLKDLYKRENYIRDDMPEEQKAAIRQRAVVNPYFTNLDTICLETGLQKYSKEYEELEPLVIEAKLCALLTELKKKKAYLEAYAAKWTREGIFEGGFYHGDPHDGNIMISDEKLTVIDFGNCTKLTKEQQEHVTRMMAAAAIGDMKTFRHGFHKLLKPEFEALYQEKRDELGRKFSEIFALGDKKAAGPRIAVALLEAQKLGLEIPAAVFNFSQGQMRIQNALDNMNRQIEETEAAATFFVDISDYNNQFDCTNSTRKSDVDQRPELLYAAKAYTKDLMFITDDREELKRLMVEYPDHMKAVFFNKFKTAARTFDGAINGFRQIVDAMNQTPVDPNNPIMVSALRAQFDLALQQIVDRSIGTMSDPALRSEMRYCLFERLTGQMVDEQKANSILERLRLQKDNVARIARAYDAMEKKYNKISAKHKNMWNPTDQEKAEFDVVCNQFLDLYFPLHMQVAPYWSFIKSHVDKLIEKNPEKREEMGFHMSRFFQRHPFGREEFMLAYNDLIGAINAGLPETNPAEFRQKRVALAHVYQKVMAQRLREKDKLYQAAVEKRKKDFPDVMSDIVDKEMSKMISRMGLVDSVIFDWKLSKITKEEDSVQENTNNDD